MSFFFLNLGLLFVGIGLEVVLELEHLFYAGIIRVKVCVLLTSEPACMRMRTKKCLSIYLSVCLSVCLSIYLSILLKYMCVYNMVIPLVYNITCCRALGSSD